MVKVKEIRLSKKIHENREGGLYTFCNIRIDLKNNCDSNISFWQLDCYWQASFFTDNEKLSIQSESCSYNPTMLKKVKHGMSISYNGILHVKIDSNQTSRMKFRIGFINLGEKEYHLGESIIQALRNRKVERRGIIWSKEYYLKIRRYKKSK